MNAVFEPLSFARGPAMKNRFMLAPLTNLQSHDDGVLSDEEFDWLTMRAKGGFGATMTCAAHVQAIGQGFPGQLGIFGDEHIEGLTRLAAAIRAEGSVAITQLHHAGNRSPQDLVAAVPVCPSDDPSTGARALSTAEVEELVEDFVRAAQRAEAAGFDGVELHGAHGYILCQFLSPALNQRDDAYGGSLAARSKIIFDILEGIRARCRPDLIVGIRLSPERFGVLLSEIRELAQQLMSSGLIDFLDMSLWDSRKEPADAAFAGRTLLSYFAELERGDVRLGIAGKLHEPADIGWAFANGVDFVLPGRVSILHHDYPNRLAADPDFAPLHPPVSAAYLAGQGLSPKFLGYMAGWQGFIDG